MYQLRKLKFTAHVIDNNENMYFKTYLNPIIGRLDIVNLRWTSNLLLENTFIIRIQDINTRDRKC